jgi:hypothetical protein
MWPTVFFSGLPVIGSATADSVWFSLEKANQVPTIETEERMTKGSMVQRGSSMRGMTGLLGVRFRRLPMPSIPPWRYSHICLPILKLINRCVLRLVIETAVLRLTY